MAQPKSPRNTYTTQFKLDAVTQLVNGNTTIKKMAKATGIHFTSLYEWKKELAHLVEKEPVRATVIEPYPDRLEHYNKAFQTTNQLILSQVTMADNIVAEELTRITLPHVQSGSLEEEIVKTAYARLSVLSVEQEAIIEEQNVLDQIILFYKNKHK